MITELCKIFKKYKSDKCPEILHSYSPSYYEELKEFRGLFENVLEIGIGSSSLMVPICGNDYEIGASLKGWRDFFIRAQIYGIDIEKTTLFTDERISTFYTDQSKSNELENTINEIKKFSKNDYLEFDIILDDGSHIVEHMILSFETLGKYVKYNGFYIIEDIKRNDLEKFKNLQIPGFSIHKVHEGINDWDDFIIYKKNILNF